MSFEQKAEDGREMRLESVNLCCCLEEGHFSPASALRRPKPCYLITPLSVSLTWSLPLFPANYEALGVSHLPSLPGGCFPYLSTDFHTSTICQSSKIPPGLPTLQMLLLHFSNSRTLGAWWIHLWAPQIEYTHDSYFPQGPVLVSIIHFPHCPGYITFPKWVP